MCSCNNCRERGVFYDCIMVIRTTKTSNDSGRARSLRTMPPRCAACDGGLFAAFWPLHAYLRIGDASVATAPHNNNHLLCACTLTMLQFPTFDLRRQFISCVPMQTAHYIYYIYVHVYNIQTKISANWLVYGSHPCCDGFCSVFFVLLGWFNVWSIFARF